MKKLVAVIAVVLLASGLGFTNNANGDTPIGGSPKKDSLVTYDVKPLGSPGGDTPIGG